MKKNKTFKLPASTYLFYLLIATLLFTSITVSSYITETNNSVTGRSAKFEVEINSETQDLLIDVNQDILTDKFDFSVKSNSEIAAYYDVIIDLKTTLPEGLSVKLDTKTADSIEGTIYKFNRVGEFAPLDKTTHNHSLIFTASEDLAININISDLQIKVLMSQDT
jgi:hypothetical protein